LNLQTIILSGSVAREMLDKSSLGWVIGHPTTW
jgi:hypothetical protein